MCFRLAWSTEWDPVKILPSACTCFKISIAFQSVQMSDTHWLPGMNDGQACNQLVDKKYNQILTLFPPDVKPCVWLPVFTKGVKQR